MMITKNKSNIVARVLLCIMLICTILGALFFVDRDGVLAKADVATTDITETLTLDNRNNDAWKNAGATADDEYYFGVKKNDSEYINTASNVSGCWYVGNDTLITNNNGVDIMEYIHVNGQSARALITENANGAQLTGTIGWLTNPAASPVYVETSSANMGIMIHILKAAFTEPITLTFKSGFSLFDHNNEVLMLSDDVEFSINASGIPTKVEKYTLSFEGLDETKTVKSSEAIGELPAVPAKDGYVGFWTIDGVAITEKSMVNANQTATPVYALEYENLLGLEDRTSWGAHEGEYYFGGVTLDPFGYFNTADSVSSAWYVGNDSVITANNGVDIMEYIYVNGQSARSLITANANGDRVANSCNCWLSNPAASPVYVETTKDSGIIIRLLKSAVGDTVTLTFKAGFSLIRNDGEVIYLSSDVTYTYANGVLTGEPQYSVTFDGENEQIVRINKKATKPATDPTKAETEGYTYTFDGWYNGETKWNFADPVTENLALTAKFIETEKEKFTVTFCADNGTSDIPVSVYVNSYVKEDQIPANPEKDAVGDTAYTFVCWSLDGENAYEFSTPITQDITLTAVYTTKPLYTVTIGGEPVKVVEGAKLEKPADPTKDSTEEYEYTFDGWYNGETKWDFENDTVTSDLELVAKYNETKRKYTVSFNVTGNEAVTLATATVEYGTTYDLTNLLDGVDVSAYNYTITVNGEAVTSVEVLADVTVDVAFVARVYYTVTVDGVEQTVEKGEKAVKPENEPTKEATKQYEYAFDGWYNGETKWDFDNDTVTSDLTLVAKFAEKTRKYTVSFEVTGNDSIKLDSVEVEYGTTYDLSKLLDGKDVSGYTYSISVGGFEKSSFKVIGDTTVKVVFTEKAETNNNTSSFGCGGTISGASVLLCAMALSVVAVMKKKED